MEECPLQNGEILRKHSGRLVLIVNSCAAVIGAVAHVARVEYEDEKGAKAHFVFHAALPKDIEGKNFHLSEYYRSKEAAGANSPYKQYLRYSPELDKEFFWGAH